ncbi:unnamed protein product [Choristocarpus tenellus]
MGSASEITLSMRQALDCARACPSECGCESSFHCCPSRCLKIGIPPLPPCILVMLYFQVSDLRDAIVIGNKEFSVARCLRDERGTLMSLEPHAPFQRSLESDAFRNWRNNGPALPGKILSPALERSGKRGLWLARLSLLTAACLYGTNYAVVKTLGGDLDPATLLALRFGLASLVLSPALHGASPGALRGGAEVGVYGALGYAAQAWGMKAIAASQMALVGSLSVLVVPALDYFGGRTVGRKTVWAAVLACAGAALLQTGVGSETGGDAGVLARLLALSTPFFFGLSTWRMEAFSTQHPEETLALTASQVAAIGGVSSVWALAGGTMPPLDEVVSLCSHPTISGGLLWTGLVTTAFVMYIETAALRTVPASEAAVIYTMDPLVGAGVAMVALDEELGPWVVVGSALVLAGCILSSLEGKRDRSTPGQG